MLVRFLPEILKEENPDRVFLSELDSRLHYVKFSVYLPNMGGGPFKISIDSYNHGESLGVEDITRVFDIVSEHDGLAITPINTAMGFKVGYDVVYSTKDVNRSFLRFIDEQLPEGYDFERLRPVFLDAKNVLTLGNGGFEKPSPIRGTYEY